MNLHLLLLDFLPLARVCNSVLASLNAIRLCAPVSLAGFVAASLNSLLADCAGQPFRNRRSGAPVRAADASGLRDVGEHGLYVTGG